MFVPWRLETMKIISNLHGLYNNIKYYHRAFCAGFLIIHFGRYSFFFFFYPTYIFLRYNCYSPWLYALIVSPLFVTNTITLTLTNINLNPGPSFYSSSSSLSAPRTVFFFIRMTSNTFAVKIKNDNVITICYYCTIGRAIVISFCFRLPLSRQRA